MGNIDYVVHTIDPSETLDRISIIYNVRKDLIQRANEFTGDEIFMFKKLIIPYTSGTIYQNDIREISEE